MNTKSLLLLVLTAALLPFTAQAKPDGAKKGGKGTPPSPEQILERMDADGSGGISTDEAKGRLEKHFDQIDADGSGEITEQELATAGEERRERGKENAGKVKEADTDGNGSISYDEANAAGLEKLIEHFEKVDADGDGEVTKEEMKEMRKAKGKKERKGQKEGV